LGSKGCYIKLTKQTPLTTGHVVFDTVLPTVTGYLKTATMVPIEPTPTELMFDMLHTASREAYTPFIKPSNLLLDTNMQHTTKPFKTKHQDLHNNPKPKPKPSQRKQKQQTKRSHCFGHPREKNPRYLDPKIRTPFPNKNVTNRSMLELYTGTGFV
jgi:hypothetical protein